MKSLSLDKNNRIQSLDFYRGIAILSVVVHHFGLLYGYGNLGVDLFFVISGYLVGGILVKLYMRQSINYFKFILQRGFKIWPSYYSYLLLGSLFSYFLLDRNNPEFHLSFTPFSDIARYLFFYRNFTGVPNHRLFDGIWSLCVEEHFYFILPIVLIVLLAIKKPKINYLFYLCALMIATGFITKVLSLLYSNSKDTHSMTMFRIDQLAYGVLLYLVINYTNIKFNKLLVFITGILLLAVLIYFDSIGLSTFYCKTVFRSLVGIPFFLIIFSTFTFSFGHFSFVKFFAKYSYNMYLWHSMALYFTFAHFGTTVFSFFFYMGFSLLLAYLTTHLIEIPALNIRNKLFPN